MYSVYISRQPTHMTVDRNAQPCHDPSRQPLITWYHAKYEQVFVTRKTFIVDIQNNTEDSESSVVTE